MLVNFWCGNLGGPKAYILKSGGAVPPPPPPPPNFTTTSPPGSSAYEGGWACKLYYHQLNLCMEQI